jgi:hypothetical protein
MWINPEFQWLVINTFKSVQKQLRQSIPLLSDQTRLAISTNTVEQNTYVRHKEFNVLLSEDIVGFTETRVTKRKYHLTEKGKSLGFRTNKNGTILNPIGDYQC